MFKTEQVQKDISAAAGCRDELASFLQHGLITSHHVSGHDMEPNPPVMVELKPLAVKQQRHSARRLADKQMKAG